jgi:acyl-CoA hydrolase
MMGVIIPLYRLKHLYRQPFYNISTCDFFEIMTINKLKRTTKTPAESETIMTEVVYPNDTNPMGMLQGGRMMQWMDTASAVCAQTHAERIAATVSLDKVLFRSPAKIGDIITIKAKITRAFETSMEIFVQAWARKVVSRDTYLINEAYFTFVALDENEKPAVVPAVKPLTAIEKKLYKEALERKQIRTQARQQL